MHGFPTRRAASACLLALAALGPGCFTSTNLKTAEVTPPGRLAFGIGATAVESTAVPMFDVRLGLAPRWEVGTRCDFLSVVAETRLQLLAEEPNRIDGAIELGVGSTFGVLPRPFTYGGVTVSKRVGNVAPYFHVRYIDALIDSDAVGKDEGDRDLIAEILFYMPPELDEIWQVSFGVEFSVSEKLGFIPEVLICPGLKDNAGNALAFYNLAVRFRFW